MKTSCPTQGCCICYIHGFPRNVSWVCCFWSNIASYDKLFVVTTTQWHPYIISVQPVPSIYPEKDQYVASNSLVNITFNCSAPIGSNPGWEINGSQIVGDDFIQRISRMGIFIYSDSQYSLIIVTPMARLRPEYKVLSMECLSTHNETLSTDNTKNYSVITFGRFNIIKSLLRL